MKITEIEGNLFNVNKEYTLVHCISACAEMGKGIAVEFAKRNPEMREYIRKQSPKISDVFYYQTMGEHPVYNLITKQYYDLKPKRAAFNESLLNLKRDMKAKGITKIAMPRIGSGLDKLSWAVSFKFIKEIFENEEVEILVYNLPNERKAFDGFR